MCGKPLSILKARDLERGLKRLVSLGRRKLRKLISGEETFSAGTLGEFVERVWRPSLLVKERAYSTLANYELALKSDISQLYPIPLNQLRIEVLTEFLIGLKRKHPNGPKTVRNKWGLLAGILNLAFKAGRVDHQDWKLLEPPKKMSKREPTLTPEQVDSLLSELEGTPYYAPAWTAAYLGLRKNEVLGLKPHHIIETKNGYVLEVQDNRQPWEEKKILKGKNPGEVRRLALPDEFAAIMLGFDLPFKGSGGYLLDGKTLCKRLHTKSVAVGLTHLATMQMLRRSCSTNLRAKGVPETVIQSILGHTSINTTLIYLEPRDQEVRQYLGRQNPASGGRQMNRGASTSGNRGAVNDAVLNLNPGGGKGIRTPKSVPEFDPLDYI